MNSSNDLSDELIRRLSVGGALGKWNDAIFQLGRTCCYTELLIVNNLQKK